MAETMWLRGESRNGKAKAQPAFIAFRASADGVDSMLYKQF